MERGDAGQAISRMIVNRLEDRPRLTPRLSFALEEAFFLRNKGLLVRLWENGESVIIGRAQLAEYETDVGYCRANRIPIVRRFTAGGTVYNGPGDLNWSLFVGREVKTPGLRYVTSPKEIFKMAAGLLQSSLVELGVHPTFKEPNSIVTPEGKVTGMAAFVSKDGFLCHGTLLVDADLELVKALTTPSSLLLERRYTRSRDVKTANSGVDVDSFIRTFRRTFEDETGMKLDIGRVSAGEKALADKLLASRYSKESWNLGDPFAR